MAEASISNPRRWGVDNSCYLEFRKIEGNLHWATSGHLLAGTLPLVSGAALPAPCQDLHLMDRNLEISVRKNTGHQNQPFLQFDPQG